MKKIISITLLSIFITVLFSINPLPINNSKITYNIGGITSQTLEAVAEELSADDEISISVGLDYDLLDTTYLLPPDDCSYVKAKELKQKRAELGFQYYSRINNNLVKNINGKNYKSRYVSSYLPFITYTYELKEFKENKDEILSSLSTNENIKTIDITQNEEVQESISSALLVSSATSITSSNYRGSGINVGILEPGIVRASHTSMSGVDLTIRNALFHIEYETEHATKMAAIIANQTNGICPNASIYSADIDSNITNSLDWFVSNDVDIVNMSFGQDSTDGTYSSDSAKCDMCSYCYGIMFVASAGNCDGDDDDLKTSNPGLGYNVLSVGNYESVGNIADYSCYIEESGPEKPNIVTYGIGISISNFSGASSGTSVSAAVTTGMITSLMTEFSDLIGNPAKTMALVMASCDDVDTTGSHKLNGLNDKWGTGLFNYATARSKHGRLYSFTNSSTSTASTTLVNTFPYYYSVSAEAKICIYWQAYANGTVSNSVYTSYSVQLCNVANREVAYVSCGNSNYMYININSIEIGGSYKLKLYQNGARKVANDEIVYVCF